MHSHVCQWHSVIPRASSQRNICQIEAFFPQQFIRVRTCGRHTVSTSCPHCALLVSQHRPQATSVTAREMSGAPLSSPRPSPPTPHPPKKNSANYLFCGILYMCFKFYCRCPHYAFMGNNNFRKEFSPINQNCYICQISALKNKLTYLIVRKNANVTIKNSPIPKAKGNAGTGSKSFNNAFKRCYISHRLLLRKPY